SLVYNGYWWSPERAMLQTMIDESQAPVNGVVRLQLYKGNVIVVGRKSDNSLFDTRISTFEGDGGAYEPKVAVGFIKLAALRMRIAANSGRKLLKYASGLTLAALNGRREMHVRLSSPVLRIAVSNRPGNHQGRRCGPQAS